MQRVAVLGATGLVGRHLVEALRARGDEVIAFSRRATNVAGVATTQWDPTGETLPRTLLGVTAFVNLAGESIGARRWSRTRRDRLRDSRVQTTETVVAATGASDVGILVNASAVGYYGAREEPVDETSSVGAGFLAALCRDWELAARRGESHARVVRLRSGIVLARDGGLLPVLRRVTDVGLSGPLGSGSQWTSWIHVDDLVSAIVVALDDASVEGALNATAPRATRQREFARVLARRRHRPARLRTPAWMLRLTLGEASSLLLGGQDARPAALLERGFAFRHPSLESALEDLLDPRL